MSKAIGIDLGTTNSLVAYVKDAVPFVIPDGHGDTLMPSIVSVSVRRKGGKAERQKRLEGGKAERPAFPPCPLFS